MKLDYHEHPLTLIENSAELLCRDCGYHLDESYSCNCGFYYKCSLCNERVSGSCYTCELCWQKSPVAHQSCYELPQEIRITHYRPQCLLHFEKESGQSEELDCGFCNEKHRDKYRCEDCRFQIGVGCASKVVNLHEGRPHVKHFSHRHPLTLLELDEMICKLCYENIDGPSYGYGCAPCKFYIHALCLDEFLPEIRHNFHPQHSLSLYDYTVIGKANSPCDACRLSIKGWGYRCDKCNFGLHCKCTTLKPNIKYKGHEHLLILLENPPLRNKCEACGHNEKVPYIMRCVECRLNFHLQCGSQTLPPTVWLKEHDHPLIIHTIGKDNSDIIYCSVCGEEISHTNPLYRCVEHEYFAHVRCSITEVQYDDNGKLRHFSHRDILIFRDVHEKDVRHCDGCGKDVQGSAYVCDRCPFYLHKSCAELPNLIYDPQLHEHFLTLQRISYKNGKCSTCDQSKCGTCDQTLSGLLYHCDTCGFHLDINCASRNPSVNLNVNTDDCTFHEGQERIAHFCDKHQSCGALLQEIWHPFHPRHSLRLSFTEKRGYRCKACCFNTQGLRYRCDECDFDLHPECISLKQNIEYKFHKHPLTLIENVSYDGECEACGRTSLGNFFMRCVQCDINFHVECGPNPLSPTILCKQSGHRLTLRTGTVVEDNSGQPYCNVCNKERNQVHPAYYCADFDYWAHVRCVITEVQVDEREKVKHFSHPHFLFLLENKRNDNISCSACDKKIQAKPSYGCKSCEFYLHKSCAELPTEIQHPFHRHPLNLTIPHFGEEHECKACLQQYNSLLSYHCQPCNFSLDLECSLLLPSIRNEELHIHILTFFKKLNKIPECDYCKKLIPPSKLTHLDSFYLRCMTCNFSRHFLCCPLPETIEHGSHHHPLTLKDNFVDIYDGFHDEQYCCDFCENRQDAQEPVYHCEECNFVIDIECVFDEVMQFLKGIKHKGVQGRIVSREITNNVKGLTYKNIMQSLTKEEKKLTEAFIDEVKKIEKGTLLNIFKELIEINQPANVRISRKLSNEDEELFVQYLFKSMAEKMAQLESIDEALVDLRGYKIFPKLAPMLKKLLDKYGDIGASCRFTQLLKTIPLTTLCVVMQEMRDTNVIDIKDDSIILWWFHLKLVQSAGFRTDFALDHVKRIVHVHFLLDEESPIKSKPCYGIHKEIAQRYKEIDEQTRKIEILKKEAQEMVSAHGSERSRTEANDENETLKLSWNKAASGMLDDIPEF